MPEEGVYRLANVGFTKEEQPYLSLQKEDEFIPLFPMGETLTLVFDTSRRFCIGWGDMSVNMRYVCPDNATIDDKYEQCPACQKRTGFNPAFYHATSVSQQQEARNQEPHFLYLAYFAPDVVKVGISFAARNRSRLLEQGARAALVLDMFPSANIARQYEARIAQLEGIAEMIQLQKKIALLDTPLNLDHAKHTLLELRQQLQKSLAITFANDEPQTFEHLYFPQGTPSLHDLINRTTAHSISGNVKGMLGSLLISEHQDSLLLLPLKKYLGYNVTISNKETQLELPPRQASLF